MFGGLMRRWGLVSFRSAFVDCPRGCGELAMTPCPNCGEQKWMMDENGDALCCRYGCEFRASFLFCPGCGGEVPLRYVHRFGKDPYY